MAYTAKRIERIACALESGRKIFSDLLPKDQVDEAMGELVERVSKCFVTAYKYGFNSDYCDNCTSILILDILSRRLSVDLTTLVDESDKTKKAISMFILKCAS